MKIEGSSLGDLPRLRDCRRRRVSSWDVTGGNADFWRFAGGETKTIAEITGAGCIKHIWITIGGEEPFYARKILLRMYWDGEGNPSLEVPVGDFFGIGHGIIKNFVSLPLTMSPSNGRGFNCFFPMPFAHGAKIELTNECAGPDNIYFYVDYEEYEELEEGVGRFHAQWRRENPTQAEEKEINLDGAGNYVILEAEGQGHYVGCHIDIDCFKRQKGDWYGEGDDMIFIDGEAWPPALHGTGTEDYFNLAYGPQAEYCAPYHGLTVYSGTEEWPWKGKNSLYRFHIEDPIYFAKSIKVTIEHGHANDLTLDISSTAYWYQTEPHKPSPPLLQVEESLPRTQATPQTEGGMP